MSIINQVRDIIADMDGKPFTIYDCKEIWEGKPDQKRIFKAVGTGLNKLKNYHKEIRAISKAAFPHSNGKRTVIYEAIEIEESRELKESFNNKAGKFYFNMKLMDIFVASN